MHYHVPKPFYRKSRNTWYVELNGRQVNLGKDRDDAFQRYHEIMASPPSDREARSNPAGDGVRLTELFDRFLTWVQKHRSAATYEWYRYRLQRFADRHPKLTVEQLRPYHVQEWGDSYPEHSPTTTRNYMRSLKRCLKWAQGLGYVDMNPIEHLSVPVACPRDTYVTAEEFATLLSQSRNESFRDLLEVTYETGCRPQESLRLEIRHLDLSNQRWILPRSEAKGKEAPRIVYLSEKALDITRRVIAGRSQGYVFRNSNGKPWQKNAVNCAFKRIQYRMGMAEMARQRVVVTDDEIVALMATLSKTKRVRKSAVQKTEAELRCEAKRKLTYRIAQTLAPKYSLYSLRHSWATNALQRGVDALTVASQEGGFVVPAPQESRIVRLMLHIPAIPISPQSVQIKKPRILAGLEQAMSHGPLRLRPEQRHTSLLLDLNMFQRQRLSLLLSFRLFATSIAVPTLFKEIPEVLFGNSHGSFPWPDAEMVECLRIDEAICFGDGQSQENRYFFYREEFLIGCH